MGVMINVVVLDKYIDIAKAQIEAFKQTPFGKYRYNGVDAWKGIVAEFAFSDLAESNPNWNVEYKSKGLDTSGITDDKDLLINGKKTEVKTATKMYYKYIMPKIHDEDKPKDIYVGCKYNDTVTPNEIIICGWMKREDVIKYPIKQNKGAPYYEVPISDLKGFNV